MLIFEIGFVFTQTKKVYGMKNTKPLGRLLPHQLQSAASQAVFTAVSGVEAFLVGLCFAKSTCHPAWIRLHQGMVVRFKTAYQQPFAALREPGKVDLDYRSQDRARTPEAYFGDIIKIIPNL